MTFIRMNPDLNQQALSCLLATKCLKWNYWISLKDSVPRTSETKDKCCSSWWLVNMDFQECW